MRYREIKESPIGNLEVHGMDAPGTFPDVDRKLLNNPAHVRKIRQRFEKVPFDFDLYFINQPGKKYTHDYGLPFSDGSTATSFTVEWGNAQKNYVGMRSPEFIKQHFGVKVAADPAAITIVYLSNANAENTISMTPWIVAHRAGHAIIDAADMNVPGEAAELQNVMIKLPSASQIIVDGITLLKAMTTRSARIGILDSSEYKVELIAQYIINARISLAIPPGVEVADPVATQKQLNLYANKIAVRIDKIMDECVGHILVAI